MANISTILSNALTVHLRGYLSGLVLSTAGSSATFSVASGVAVDDVQKDFMNLATAISKTTSAWAVGTGNGGIDTGAVANSTWYHVYLIKRPDTGVVDVLFSLSASAPTMPGSYTLKRRIGSMLTNGSAQWTLFTQNGDEFLWATSVNNANNVATAATSTLVTATVPTGVRVFAKIQTLLVFSTTSAQLFTSSPDAAVAVSASPALYQNYVLSGAGVNQSPADLLVRTDTSARVNVAQSGTGSTYYMNTYGWIDTRGKL